MQSGVPRRRAAPLSSVSQRVDVTGTPGRTFTPALVAPVPDSRLAPATGLAISLAAGIVIAFAGLNALYLCVTLVGCALLFVDFRIGVVLLVVLFPLSRTIYFPHELLGIKGLNPLNLLLVATLTSCLVHGAGGLGLRRLVPPSLLLYVVPLLLGGVIGASHVYEIPFDPLQFQITFRDVPGYLMEFVFKPATLLVLALLVAAAAASTPKPERLLLPMIGAVASVCLLVIGFVARSGISLAQLASSDAREVLTALGPHANEFGHMFAIAFALLLFTWHGTELRWLRLLLALALGLDAIALLLTFSRSSFSGLVVVLALYAWWHRRVRTLVAAFMVGIVTLLLLPEAFYERLSTGFGGGVNEISAGRVDYLWLPLLPEVLRNPVFGNGLASILWSEPMRQGAGGFVLSVNHPHSAYLEALLDVGIAGFIAICIYLMQVFKGFRELAADTALSPTLRGFFAGAAAGLVGLLVADIADNSLMPKTEQVFLWFAIGMMYGLRRQRA